MLHEKAVKKVEKALGIKVENWGTRWGCNYNGQVISWIASPNWQDPDKLEAHNWHVRRENDHSDSMVDYFAGYHVDNVTQLIRAVKHPNPSSLLEPLFVARTINVPTAMVMLTGQPLSLRVATT